MISTPSPPDEEMLMPLDPRTRPITGPTETPATPSTWTHLPALRQQEVIRLLTQMLLAHVARRPLARPVRGGDHERRQ
jgi:hypothetical protein